MWIISSEKIHTTIVGGNSISFLIQITFLVASKTWNSATFDVYNKHTLNGGIKYFPWTPQSSIHLSHSTTVKGKGKSHNDDHFLRRLQHHIELVLIPVIFFITVQIDSDNCINCCHHISANIQAHTFTHAVELQWQWYQGNILTF